MDFPRCFLIRYNTFAEAHTSDLPTVPPLRPVRLSNVSGSAVGGFQLEVRMRETRPIEVRFEEHVDRTGKEPSTFWDGTISSPCWKWIGARHPAGYGIIRHAGTGRLQLAHRFAYEANIGPIPEGLEIDHKCRNPECTNPEHLEPVTHQINCLRGNAPAAIAHRKGECTRGHKMTPENVYRVMVAGSPILRCKICTLAYQEKQ